MQTLSDDCAKRRLTERAELTVAAEFLIARGFDSDEIAVHLSRFYYIDIDALNDVVSTLAPAHSHSWKHVA
ncbi:hypothetical protein [Mesorhizobium sp. CAU 1732]|uniref:hypothetical protein n=1 Tax=Mesorhizobium sp. CAU 1732 TaxID=3140358 RepID=UPI00326092A8